MAISADLILQSYRVAILMMEAAGERRKNVAIGDVTSPERGSGARYNDGKAKVEYIPAGVIADFYRPVCTLQGRRGQVACNVLWALDRFEQGVDTSAETALELVGSERWKGAGEQFHFGSKKYAPWNWAKGMPWSVPVACAKRHLIAVLEGEENDPESGVDHFGAVACNLIMLLHFIRHYPEGDDRPPRNIYKAPE